MPPFFIRAPFPSSASSWHSLQPAAFSFAECDTVLSLFPFPTYAGGSILFPRNSLWLLAGQDPANGLVLSARALGNRHCALQMGAHRMTAA